MFTISLILAVVFFTGFSSVVTLKSFLHSEMKRNQETWFNNFRGACADALYLGDDLAIQATSESLEKAIPEIAYAVFVDKTRPQIQLGGLESLERFKKLSPSCPPSNGGSTQPNAWVESTNGQKWQHYCLDVDEVNLRGEHARGVVALGFNLNMIDAKVDATIQRIWPRLALSMLAVLLIGLVVAFILARRLTTPILHLTEGAKAIGDGLWDTRIPVESKDELGFLAHEFNLMAAKLKELDQLKDDFVSSVSHELRSPLAAISGYAELLQSKPIEDITPEKRAKALDIIRESTERLARFINDILDLAKIKAGQIELRRKSFDLSKLVEEITGLFHPLLEKKGIQCLVDVPPDVPLMFADEEKVRQVLTNLLSNALKFTPTQGKIRIIAKNKSDFVQISVEDTGMGIPDDQKEAVFERFRQVKRDDQPLSSVAKSTGLGLAIAKGDVEAHGGRIWIESEPNKGTSVSFTIPLEQPANLFEQQRLD